MTSVIPEKLFAYASRFSKRAEAAGSGKTYPTLRQAARRFKVPMSAIEDAIDDWTGDGYMRAAVAEGLSGGIFVFESKTDWLVEAYN